MLRNRGMKTFQVVSWVSISCLQCNFYHRARTIIIFFFWKPCRALVEDQLLKAGASWMCLLRSLGHFCCRCLADKDSCLSFERQLCWCDEKNPPPWVMWVVMYIILNLFCFLLVSGSGNLPSSSLPRRTMSLPFRSSLPATAATFTREVWNPCCSSCPHCLLR